MSGLPARKSGLLAIMFGNMKNESIKSCSGCGLMSFWVRQLPHQPHHARSLVFMGLELILRCGLCRILFGVSVQSKIR